MYPQRAPFGSEAGESQLMSDTTLQREDALGARPTEDGSRRPRERIALMGPAIDSITEADAIACIIDSLDRGEGGWVLTVNLDFLRQFSSRPEVRGLFDSADLVVADGMPLVWASRLQGTPLPERTAGSELVWSLTAEATLAGKSIFLLGDLPEAARMAERTLRANYPGVRIAGRHSPPLGFESDPGELERIRSRLLQARPDIVYVALGFPKQELLISQLREDLPSTWFMGVGASLSFVGGRVRRAPTWMMRIGMEWAHRLAQEPRRLAKRYLVHGVPFGLRLLAHALVARVLRRRRHAPAPAADLPARRRVVFGRGALERERARAVADLMEELAEVDGDGAESGAAG